MKLTVMLVASLVGAQARAGELYARLHGQEPRKVLFELFEKPAFSPEDSQDLDRLWVEGGYTEDFVVRTFEQYRRAHPDLQHAYQEVILWHTSRDVLPAETSPEEFAAAAELFHQKASLFNGTVRLIGGFLDAERPYRRGLCRWIAPNTFVMLYVVRQAREPYMGPYFPADGGAMVSQTMY